MSEDEAIRRAIVVLSQSDPIPRLLQQVALGRLKPTDAGLRAVTDTWLKTYTTVLETIALSRQALLRLDPRPRLAVLIDAGVLEAKHPAASALQAVFEAKLAQRPV